MISNFVRLRLNYYYNKNNDAVGVADRVVAGANKTVEGRRYYIVMPCKR